MSSNAAIGRMLPRPGEFAGDAKLILEERVRLVLEAAGVGTWELRPRTGEHVLSPRSRQLLGIADDEPISIGRLLAALHPGDRERWREAAAEVLDPGGSGKCSLEFRTAGAVPRCLAISGRAIFEGMRAVHIVGTLREIIEEKRIQEDRDFRLAELGHDLRGPLHAISMGIGLLQRDAPGQAPLLSAMQRTVREMNQLVDHLLSPARAHEGEIQLKREHASLAAICRQAIAETALAHPGHPVDFECWDEGSGEWDADRLLQLLRNLISDAIDHDAPGEPVVVSVTDCSQEVLLSVAHPGGQPIPDIVREQLFDPARRGMWSSDHMGLYIVREIVREHGGWIGLTSDESATVFHLWLPKKGSS